MILVAGLGNELRGDDGFGVAVARRLQAQPLPAHVTVRELGLRSFDLALALLEEGVERAVLVDAVRRGGAAGTVHLLEVPADAGQVPLAGDAHGLHPAAVLGLVRALGGAPPPLVVVGCEPGDLASEEEPSTDLSPPVAAAVDRAADLVRTLCRRAGAPGAAVREDGGASQAEEARTRA